MVVLSTLMLVRLKSMTLALVVVAIAAPALFGAMKIADRQSGGASEIAERGIDELAQGRLEAWETAYKMARARPLTGIGIGNFPGRYYVYTDYWASREMAVHSMWFQVLAETGFIGFGLFVAMIAASFAANAQTMSRLAAAHGPNSLRSTCLGLQAALAGTCASGTFLSQAHTWPVYVIVALIAALANHSRAYGSSAQRDNQRTLRSAVRS